MTVAKTNNLLHRRRLLLTHAGEAFLDPAREFFLAGELDLRVFLGHPDRAVTGNLRRLGWLPHSWVAVITPSIEARCNQMSADVSVLGKFAPLVE